MLFNPIGFKSSFENNGTISAQTLLPI